MQTDVTLFGTTWLLNATGPVLGQPEFQLILMAVLLRLSMVFLRWWS